MHQNNLDYLHRLRHSAEHVLHDAAQKLYPKIYKAMGPATDDGFYFDFDNNGESITDADFAKIEAQMQTIIDANLPIIKKVISKKDALELFKDNPYKIEWIEEHSKGGEELTVYWTGEPESDGSTVDLCKGPHVERTGEIKAFKLLSIAGAYWRGDSKNKMLTRIYGTAFANKEDLDQYLWQIEEAKKRDHRKLGKELELLMFHETSPGVPYWLPKGVILYNELVNYWRIEHKKRGYQEIVSPLINKKELYDISGHWDHYIENMFIANMGENEIYGLKPMNCPNAMVVFGSRTRSYKELPLRLSDTDQLHRYELSGTLSGLFRVRGFRQDDSHNFITEGQVASEFNEIFDIAENFYKLFGLNFKYRLGTRPDKYMGDIESWDKAEKALLDILKTRYSNDKYFVLEKDGAFYGPKVDIVMEDALKREWQMGTIQLDFQIPKNFGLKYTSEDGSQKMPVVVHRVIYGSLERFIGIIIEHFAGAFPVWIAPVQVEIIMVSDKSKEYAKSVYNKLDRTGIRVELNDKDESMGNKIRKATEQKVPYMLVLGEKEAVSGTVSIRQRDGKTENAASLDIFIKKVQTNISAKSLDL